MRASTAVLTLCTAILLLLGASPGARAQFDKLKNTTPEQRAKLQTELMKAKLGLTPEEEAKIAALNLKYAQKMEPVIKGSSGPFMEMREARSINEEKEAEMKQVLTPAQFGVYLAAKEEIREKFEERIGQ
jgi:hypothetical protein